MMGILCIAIQDVILSFVEMDLWRSTVPVQPIGKPSGHIDGAGLIHGAMAQKKGTFVSLNLDRRGGKQVV